MAYEDTPTKPIEIREGRRDGFKGHDGLIDGAKASGKYGYRTDVAAEGVGYLGVDDLDRIRRRKLK